jgi:pimeloyl-ACP methyl ester carboxylesterase
MLRPSHGALCALLGLQFTACASDSEPAPEMESNAALPAPPLPAPARPPAPAADSACVAAPDGVSTILRPMFPGRPDSPSFGYSFKVYPGTDPTLPTVIYLPGGPGEASISAEREVDAVPAAYTLIATDPRGVGCNAPVRDDDYPSEFYDSVFFADDVLGIVQALALDNYILYGLSYGTELATITASRAEAQGITPPRAVVLEGVLGKVFARDGEVEEVFQSQWRILRDRLPEAVRAQLSTTPLPLGLSAEEWGSGITTMLSLGTVAPPLTLAESLLLSLSPEASDEEREVLRETVLALNESSFDAFGLRLHEEVACHEITETNFRTLSLEDGELVRTEAYCEDVPLDRPYAASDWPLSAPIYYFSGTDDPNTPSWQAQAHWDAELGAPRQLVGVIGGGHNPVSLNLSDCLDALWSAIAQNSGFSVAAGSCAWPTMLTSAAAGG